MSTQLMSEVEREESVRLKKIQKKLTFMNYIKGKSGKSEILQSSKKVRGANIIKNKDIIL